MTAPDLPEDLLGQARERALGPDESTDPRRALIRTDPGRHAANRGPAFGPDDPPMLLRGGPVLPVEVAASWGTSTGSASQGGPIPTANPVRVVEVPYYAGAAPHRCPEVEPSHDGWWFSVGLGTGFTLAALAVLVWTWWG